MLLRFSNPAWLLLLLAVPLVVRWWLRRRGAALPYPTLRLVPPVSSRRNRWARWGGAGLRGLGLACLIVGLAGPRWPDLHSRVPTQGIAIALAVDVSGSMAEPDFVWQDQRLRRLDAVKRAFHLFAEGGTSADGTTLPGRPDDLLSLVVFATRPESACPLTLSHSVLLQILDAQEPRGVPTESETNIGDAIAWGLEQLGSASDRRRILIVLSDGEHNVPPPALKPRQAAQLAANLGIPIYTIDAAGDARPEEVAAPARASDREAGAQTLQVVASMTGGQYFRAADAAALQSVCQEIDRLERKPIESFQYRRHYETYPWFGLAALLLLMGVQALEWTIWLRVP